MTIVKRIFIYLKGNEDFWLWYKHEDDFTIKVYIDVDWDSNVDDTKRTSGGAFILRDKFIPWLRKKQSCISQSTTQAEYVYVTINC